MMMVRFPERVQEPVDNVDRPVSRGNIRHGNGLTMGNYDSLVERVLVMLPTERTPECELDDLDF